jgi:hypothetical protein
LGDQAVLPQFWGGESLQGCGLSTTKSGDCNSGSNQGVVADQAELANLGRMSRAILTQIRNLPNLAPKLQEHMLHLQKGSFSIGFPGFRGSIGASEANCGKQRPLVIASALSRLYLSTDREALLAALEG